MSSRPEVVSLFSGIGGLDLGFVQAGYDVVWANEIDSDACDTYSRNIGHEIEPQSIDSVMRELPKASVLIGGPPCQAFSLVGKRRENDPRSEMVFRFVEAVRRVQPEVFVLENVPGLAAASINGIQLIEILRNEFSALGYDTDQNKIMATDFLVPQKRQRLLLIGRKRRRRKNAEFSLVSREDFAGILGVNAPDDATSASDALADLGRVVPSVEPNASYRSKPQSDFARLMRISKQREVSLHFEQTMSERERQYIKFIPPGGNYTSIPDHLATDRIKRIKLTGGRTTTYARLHPDRPSYTVNTYFNRPNVGSNFHYGEDRLISPREALRLQSFPDDFEITFSNRRSLHMQIGNAVPPLLARALAESIANCYSW